MVQSAVPHRANREDCVSRRHQRRPRPPVRSSGCQIRLSNWGATRNKHGSIHKALKRCRAHGLMVSKMPPPLAPRRREGCHDRPRKTVIPGPERESRGHGSPITSGMTTTRHSRPRPVIPAQAGIHAFAPPTPLPTPRHHPADKPIPPCGRA